MDDRNELAEMFADSLQRLTRENERLAAERDALLTEKAATLAADVDTCVRLRDAEANSRRYLWLRERLDSVDWFYGDPPRAMLMFHIPSNMRVSANLDATIDGEMRPDQARQQGKKG